MPTEPRVVIDLSRRPRIVAAGYAVHGAAGKGSVERYHLARLWSLHAYRYHATLFIDEQVVSIAPGCATLLAPGALLRYEFAGLSPHFFVHFQLDEAAAAGSGDSAATEFPIELPVVTDLGPDLGRFESDIADLAGDGFESLRAQVRLWELLWQLADRARARRMQHHPSVEKAVGLIELRLGGPISIAALARECALSHNHLTRLFRAEFGTTIAAYIRQRRALRACHLLQQSSLPIKAVAAQVGVRDLRQFGAMMKSVTGRGPRAWRTRTPGSPSHQGLPAGAASAASWNDETGGNATRR